jgi:hypothetical protein
MGKYSRGGCLGSLNASESGLNKHALINFFRKGLTDYIKTRLASTLEESFDMEGFIAMCKN